MFGAKLRGEDGGGLDYRPLGEGLSNTARMKRMQVLCRPSLSDYRAECGRVVLALRIN